MAKPRNGKPEESADANSFRDAVRDVKPLAQRELPPRLAHRPQPRARRGIAPATPDAAEPPLIESTVTAAETLVFRRSGVREQTLRRLRRGGIPVEAEVDLHGHTQSSARQALAEFLADARAAGCRCVRVIHGKGSSSGARGPILKSAVNQWLRRDLDVLAFVSARPIDGGTGALYVLLHA
jgi:DNA-nicking Smr family endonuclease